ncbi:MAG: hypothetical protein NTZ10_01610 [Candidatus Saganbacteria bacterium]|nr:hypothetical protein [Candidatus Saganbacteria bacterium]
MFTKETNNIKREVICGLISRSLRKLPKAVISPEQMQRLTGSSSFLLTRPGGGLLQFRHVAIPIENQIKGHRVFQFEVFRRQTLIGDTKPAGCLSIFPDQGAGPSLTFDAVMSSMLNTKMLSGYSKNAERIITISRHLFNSGPYAVMFVPDSNVSYYLWSSDPALRLSQIGNIRESQADNNGFRAFMMWTMNYDALGVMMIKPMKYRNMFIPI